ncbi:kinase-like protein [Rhizopogon vinicolor AM-OR11-026]|uniref:Kinase-like protein n=1 Tax=Rhizopogon vinicolor AM-OR11-026 TaxID=1314800 RepID=A0A1B7MM86_9AGAM|nr:kinase-like protein [Rhizopogon vinicolor AM-OR11-026]
MTASGPLRCSSPTETQDTGSHEHLPYKTCDQTLSSDSVGHEVQPQAGTATMPLSRSSSRTTLVRLLSRRSNASHTTSTTLHSFATASSLSLALRSSVGMREHNPPTDLTGQIFGTINDHVTAGAFGNVYRCEWRRTTDPVKIPILQVAVKVFHTSDDPEDLRRIRREAGIWARLVHENIVSFIGTTKGFGPSPALVSLWFPHGTLWRLIADQGDRLSIRSKLNLLHDIASGLHYLHSFPIVHGDITSSNILIDIKEGQYKACLTDFGLSTVLGGFLDDHTVEGSTVRYGAIRWAAPELLSLAHDSPDVKPTKQNDIYSFGRVMYYVLTLLIPWNGINEHRVLHKILCGKEIRRPEMPHSTSDITDARWNEIELCWSIDASARPSALMVMTFLKSELAALTDDSLSCPLNVLIFGETGVGKSSVINLIVGQEVAQTSPDGPTCTLQHTFYEVILGNQCFKLWEVSSIAPMNFFQRFLTKWRLKRTYKKLYRDDGVHLLLYCMRNSRAQGTWVKDYKHFTSIVSSTIGHVPVAGVVTYLEDYASDMDEWWKKNEQNLERQGVQFSKHACIMSLPNDPAASPVLCARRRQSEQIIRSLICYSYQAGRTSFSVNQVPTS